ncbi:unnamed protein product [Discosporangium mesarthrocarpum]
MIRGRHTSTIAAGSPVTLCEEDGRGTVDEDKDEAEEKDVRERRRRSWRLKKRMNSIDSLLGANSNKPWRACLRVLARLGVALTAILVACFLLSSLRWRAMFEVAIAGQGSGVERFSKAFTVILNTFKRPDSLEQALKHYAMCESVHSIRVVWSEQSLPPEPSDAPHLFQLGKPVLFHAHPDTSINNRFQPVPDLGTEAVFVVDDDVDVPCDHLLAAFRTWRRHRSALVGFYPRSHSHHDKEMVEGDGGWEYLYFWRVLLSGQYSMVLTKAAFLHSKYLDLYSGTVGVNGPPDEGANYHVNTAMVEARAYVDANRNCEDIAMQMAVTAASGLPPVLAFAPVSDRGLLGGISTGEGRGKWWKAPHAVKRSKCISDLTQTFCRNRVGAGGSGVGLGETEECKVLKHTSFVSSPHPTRATRGSGIGVSDMVQLSRWGLALRAPTVAEFVSADMVLVPGRVWRWLLRLLKLSG